MVSCLYILGIGLDRHIDYVSFCCSLVLGSRMESQQDRTKGKVGAGKRSESRTAFLERG